MGEIISAFDSGVSSGIDVSDLAELVTDTGHNIDPGRLNFDVLSQENFIKLTVETRAGHLPFTK